MKTKMSDITYRIQTWQESYGERKWQFSIKKFRRVIFKRSKRLGWHWEGFVRTSDWKPFNTRSEALAFAQSERNRLLEGA